MQFQERREILLLFFNKPIKEIQFSAWTNILLKHISNNFDCLCVLPMRIWPKKFQVKFLMRQIHVQLSVSEGTFRSFRIVTFSEINIRHDERIDFFYKDLFSFNSENHFKFGSFKRVSVLAEIPSTISRYNLGWDR